MERDKYSYNIDLINQFPLMRETLKNAVGQGYCRSGAEVGLE
jgi:hypothetical protein